jgi:hypothetical protein
MTVNGLGVLLIEDPGPCPVCDEDDCTHSFYGEDFYRIGDPMAKHPIVGRREIPAPHRIFHEGRLMFAEGDLMNAEEAIRFGVPLPAGVAPPRKKGRRQRPSTIQGPQGPTEDRAHHPEDNRQA